jgi:hypothetical protein
MAARFATVKITTTRLKTVSIVMMRTSSIQRQSAWAPIASCGAIQRGLLDDLVVAFGFDSAAGATAVRFRAAFLADDTAGAARAGPLADLLVDRTAGRGFRGVARLPRPGLAFPSPGRVVHGKPAASQSSRKPSR